MKRPNKILITLISIPIVILLFFSSNIYGYFRFKHYCSTEGGLRVYEKLERNVGWLAKDKYEARVAALLVGVGFVRYKDEKDGNTYDIKYIGGDPQDDSSFEKKSADKLIPVKYIWENIGETVQSEVRLRRFGEQILNADSLKVIAYYYMFSYGKFDVRHTIFSAPSNDYCFFEPAKNIGDTSGSLRALNTAFKN